MERHQDAGYELFLIGERIACPRPDRAEPAGCVSEGAKPLGVVEVGGQDEGERAAHCHDQDVVAGGF